MYKFGSFCNIFTHDIICNNKMLKFTKMYSLCVYFLRMAPAKKKGLISNVADCGPQSKREKHYTSSTLRTALKKVVSEKWTVYKASKEFNIPWSTLKDYLKKYSSEGGDEPVCLEKISKLKRGPSFVFDPNMEQQLLRFILKMQELGFGLSANQVRHQAFLLAEASGARHPFNKTKQMAGWWWWMGFKTRYNLSLREPENLSMQRATMSNRVMINDFYDKVSELFKNLDLFDKPERLWNADETGLCFVMKSSKVVTTVGKKYVYRRTFGERGVTTTFLGCVNAAGLSVPPLIIFKGVRMMDGLKENLPPGAICRLSDKGWINTEIFQDWFDHFLKHIPAERPSVLFMDSHASHLSPALLSKAAENDIHLVTFPSHTTHLLQPLDVSVYKSLKSAFREEIYKFMKQNPQERPGRMDFNGLMTPAYLKSFSPSNIIGGFKKTGIFPFNIGVIPDSALAPSETTEEMPTDISQRDNPNQETTTEVNLQSLFQTPKSNKKRKATKICPKAKVYSPKGKDLAVPGPSNSNISGPTTKKKTNFNFIPVMMTVVKHVVENTWMMLRAKMELNGYNVTFVKFGTIVTAKMLRQTK